jgi:exopolysaccharide production protein ExoQ
VQLESLAFWFWATLIVRFALAFLFFHDQPKAATLVQALISLAFAFILIILRLLAHGSFRPLPLPRVIQWAMLYIAWTGLSLSWTFSDTFLSAVGYWAMMLLDVLVVMAMLKWDEIERISIASLKGLVAGTYAIDSIALLFAAGDEQGRLGDPEFLHPNNLGHFTSLAALVSIFFWQRAPEGSSERSRWAIGSIILSWMVVRTLSKTSIVAFAVAAAFSILVGTNFRKKTKLRILFASFLLMAVSYGFTSRYMSAYLETNPNDVTTLTGRTILWIKSWDMITERPMIGYGTLSFRNYAPQDWEIRTTHGHNEWVTQAFQLGFVGVFLTAIVYVSYYRHFRRVKDLFKRKLGTSILIFTAIEGMASAEPVGLLFPLPLLVLMSVWASLDTDDIGKLNLEGAVLSSRRFGDSLATSR